MSTGIEREVPKVAKVSWFQKFKVRTKLNAPVSVKLSTGETVALAQIYEEDVATIKKNQYEVDNALSATSSPDVKDALEKAQAARSNAAGTYKITKDPLKKREWARRVVVADSTLKSIRNMKKRIEATHDRLGMIKGDLELQLMEAEARAAEAKAYAKAGNQLRLAGEKLIDARTRAKHMKVEYANLEVNMSAAEKSIDKSDPEDLINKANKIIGRK